MNLRNESNERIRENLKITLGQIARFDISEIEDGTLIRDELGIDSLMGIEMLAKIEKHYNIIIEESLLLDITTVGEFINLIESMTKKK